MNQRERVLLIAVLGAVILVVGGLLFKWMFLDRLGKIYADISAAKADRDKKKGDRLKALSDMKALERDDPRVAQWQELSLPDDNNVDAELKSGHTAEEALKRRQDLVQGDYSKFLNTLLARSGFSANTIKVSPAPPDRKGGPIVSGKTPAYTRISFTVQATGRLDAVETMLEEFYKTPLLHQVRNLTLTAKVVTPTRTFGPGAVARPGGAPGQPGLPAVGPGLPGAPGGFPGAPGGAAAGLAAAGGFRANAAASGDLDMTMTVDALLVTNAQKRDDLLPKTTTDDKNRVVLQYQDPRLKRDVSEPLAPTLAYPGDQSDSPQRRYSDILNKNMFTGIAAQSQPSEDALTVEAAVRLTSVWYDGRWHASIFNQNKPLMDTPQDPDKPPATIRDDAQNEISIKDLSRLRLPGVPVVTLTDSFKNEVVTLRAVRIDGTGMIFQTGKLVNKTAKDGSSYQEFQPDPKYYRWNLGEYLGSRLRDPNAPPSQSNGMDDGLGGLGSDARDPKLYYLGALDLPLKPDEIKELGLGDASGGAEKK